MIKKMITERGTLFTFVAFLIVLFILPLFLPRFIVELCTQALILAILAMSLDILLGFTGLPSLGHAVYSGIAAYTMAIMLTRFGSSFIEALGLSIFLVIISAAVFGIFALRATSHYFLLITIALTMLVWGLAYRWTSLTDGENGIVVPSFDIGLPWDLTSTTGFYYFICIFFIVALLLMYAITQSPFGKTLVGVKESPSRMRALGYNIWLHKYLAFIISGFFSGFSGVLWIMYQGYVSPMDVEAIPSLEAILMVALGGPGTLFGAILGAGIVVFLKNLVSVYVERWLMIMGVIYILTVMYAPEGLVGLIRQRFRRTQGELKEVK